ncbi:MAG: hypothetical protein ACHQ53_08415 [Polyangiales bacterium]
MSREQFIGFVKGAILTLPQQLKGTLRLVDDPNIPDEGRAVAAGAILHWLSGSNTIPGVRGGLLSYVDDVLVLRLAYARIETIAPEAMARHRADSPELFGSLTEDVALLRDYLGNGVAVLDKAVERIAQTKHHGRTAAQCIADEDAGTMLYDEVQSALVDLDIEEEAVSRALKQLDPVLEGLRQRS